MSTRDRLQKLEDEVSSLKNSVHDLERKLDYVSNLLVTAGIASRSFHTRYVYISEQGAFLTHRLNALLDHLNLSIEREPEKIVVKEKTNARTPDDRTPESDTHAKGEGPYPSY